MIEARPVLLFPCNGNAVEALDCLGDTWRCIGFIDDAPEKQGAWVQGVPVHDRTALARWPDALVLAVPGGPLSYMRRRMAIESLAISPKRYARVIHPRASVSSLASIGCNSLIMAGVVLASNAVVGQHCCVLPNSVLHHDSRVGDWTLVGANVTIAGGVTVGSNCYVGGGASIMNDIQVADFALVGFGANVIRDVEAGSRVVGNPARPLQ